MRRIFIALACVSLLSSFAAGQGDDGKHTFSPTVLVELGKPNVWTMEQAHYLLERNRAHDLGIAAADLGPLDANEVVGFRIDALKTLLSGQIQFDQALGTNNSASLSQFNTDNARFNQLRARQDQLRILQTDAAGKLAAAQFDLDQLKAKQNPNQPDQQLDVQIKQAQAKVSELTAEKAAVDAEATATASALSSEPALKLSSSLPTLNTSNSVLGANDTFQKLLANVPAGLSQSKIQASIKLDNYINLQYEIVAKQLTLMRDEAGPTSRVIFLELPQSIYATQKFKPYPDLAALWGYHLVQTWWQIDSVYTLASCKETGHCNVGEQVEPFERPPDFQEICSFFSDQIPQCTHAAQQPTLSLAGRNLASTDVGCGPDAKLSREQRLVCAWKDRWMLKKYDFSGFALNDSRAPAYALDLIPRQSALNVADAHAVSRSYGFAGLFGLLSGLGGQGKYERQHDQYDQFTQQEVFASAFGKGQRTFGWTFGPLPGTKRLAPGLRTTYAVLIVPKNTRVVHLRGYGCGYRRRTVPKDPFVFRHRPEECIASTDFLIDVPSEGDNFYADEIFYKPAVAGQRTTVEIGGTFTPEIGVLINGTPLQKVVSLGQPMLEQTNFKVPDNAGDKGIQGVFELVGTKRLILSFVMPPDFGGTPNIALISPSKEAVINSFKLRIIDGSGTDSPRRLEDAGVRPMFYQAANIVQVTPEFNPDASVSLQVFGQGFDPGSTQPVFLVNGERLSQQNEADRNENKPLDLNQFRVVDSTLIQAKFSRKKNSPWHIDFYQFVPNGVHVTHATRADDGPPDLKAASESCKITDHQQDDKKMVTGLTVQLAGDFFSTAYPPDVAKQNDNISIVAPTLVSSKLWQFQAILAPKKSFKEAVVVLKGVDSPQITLSQCIDFGKHVK